MAREQCEHYLRVCDRLCDYFTERIDHFRAATDEVARNYRARWMREDYLGQIGSPEADAFHPPPRLTFSSSPVSQEYNLRRLGVSSPSSIDSEILGGSRESLGDSHSLQGSYYSGEYYEDIHCEP